MSADLSVHQVPRVVHRGGGSTKRVETHAELAAAVAEGWAVDPNTLAHASAVELAEPAAVEEVAPVPDEAEPEPPKRKPGRPKKA